MILVDTSVWIHHFREDNDSLKKLLNLQQVLIHPFIIGELALGNLQQRALILDTLQNLTQTQIAYHDEVLHFIHHKKLFGLGIGYVDAHLLAATCLTPGTLIWTYDKRLRSAALQLSLAAPV